MDSYPELGRKGKVEDPVGPVQETVTVAHEEQASREDISKALVFTTCLTHEGEADGDKNLREVDREGKADDVKSAAAGEVTETVGEEGGDELDKQEGHGVVL